MRGLMSLLILGVAACGQSGDLYLPEPAPAAQEVPAANAEAADAPPAPEPEAR
jgi:predicted small lipoprotein YifL